MIIKLKVNKNAGVFNLDLAKRKIVSIDVGQSGAMEANFPGSCSDKYSYGFLEQSVKYYADKEKTDETLEEIIESFEQKPFFSKLRPSLRLEAEK